MFCRECKDAYHSGPCTRQAPVVANSHQVRVAQLNYMLVSYDTRLQGLLGKVHTLVWTYKQFVISEKRWILVTLGPSVSSGDSNGPGSSAQSTVGREGDRRVHTAQHQVLPPLQGSSGKEWFVLLPPPPRYWCN